MNSKANYGLAEKSYGEAYEAETPTYIVFDLYMSVDRAAEIYLFNGTAVTAEKNKDDDTEVDDILKAVRIGFAYLGSTAGVTNEDAAKIQPETDLAGTKSVVIWEPVVASGENVDPKTYGFKAQTYVSETEVGETAAYKAGTYTEEVTNNYSSDDLIVADKNASSTTGKTKLFSTTGACYSKVRVYVWLEGNDPDCTVAIASQFLRLNLVFFAKEVTA